MSRDITNNLLSNQAFNVTPISASDTFKTEVDTSLNSRVRSSWSFLDSFFPPEPEPTEPTTNSSSYNSNNGFGTVNAGKAVSEAAGQNPYTDVPAIGGNNWGADLIKAPTVWNNGYTGNGVVVAVLDTGVDYNHEDLRNNIWTNTNEIAGNGIDDDGNGYVDDVRGWNFDSNSNNVYDNNGHGTHVSGTIAGENNGFGVTGIAYNAKIMPVKVLDENGSGSYSAIAKGIYYAVNNGARIINLSLGGYFSNDTLKSAIEYASSKNVIVVMAAGNDGDSSPAYPARYANNHGIAVGAVDRNNQLADFSNRSGSREIAYVTAPGVDINSTLPGNQYGNYSGTSMATPHVAGVVALMLSANPSLTESQVRNILTKTAANNINARDYNFTGVNDNKSKKDPLFPQLPPVVVSIGEDGLELRFGDVKSPIKENSPVASSDTFNTQRETNYQIINSAVNSMSRYYDTASDKNITVASAEIDWLKVNV
jgi:subtilisin family serine protease